MTASKVRTIGLRIDIESRSGTDIKYGVYRYAEDPDFAVLKIAFCTLRQHPGGRIGLSPIRELDESDSVLTGKFKTMLVDPRYQQHAFNANFERIALSKWLGMPNGQYLDPENWRCSAVLANVHGVFGTLDEVARAVRSPIKKDPEGKRLIRLFSLRDKKTGRFHEPTPVDPVTCWCGADHRDDWIRFGTYCQRDVLTEAVVAREFPPISDAVQAEYEADQRINDRGFRHFKALSEAALQQVSVEKDRVMSELQLRTGLDNPNSGKQFNEWLVTQGYPMPSLDKDHREAALVDPLIPEEVAEALVLKGQASLSSVLKHKAALDTRCNDGRIRGSLRFYGAHTGREAGRGIQPQNLPRLESSAADRARLIRGQAGQDAPTIAKGTVRSSIVPAKGHVFAVADYNAIEARCLGWECGEVWVQQEFAGAGKIYEATAAMMFGVDKDQLVASLKACGKCGHCAYCITRARGKVSCIAEGQLVLTNQGLVPIEKVSRNHLVWDGIEWVRHDGVVYLGMKEVITYDGLTATPDHRIWCTTGSGAPTAFGNAASRGDHLVQSGTGRNSIPVSDRYRDRAEVHEAETPGGLRARTLRLVLAGVLVSVVERPCWKGRLRLVRGSRPTATKVARSQTHSGKAALYESERSCMAELRGAWGRVQVLLGVGGRSVVSGDFPGTGSFVTDRPSGQRRTLRAGKPKTSETTDELEQSPLYQPVGVRSPVLALRRIHRAAAAVLGIIQRSNHRTRWSSRRREAEELAANPVTTRVYDLLNAGPRHRYTVSGKLVHNCLALGYGGAAGALVTMGAEDAGIDIGNYNELHAIWVAAGRPGKFHEWNKDEHDYPELIRLRDLYRAASPETVRFWKLCARAFDLSSQGRGARFGQNDVLSMVRDGKHNRLVLPSGRSIWYRYARSHPSDTNPERIDRRTFMGKSNGVGHVRTETHGGKLTENITQAVARDVLFDLIMRIESDKYTPGKIVLHVHDEVVLEVPEKYADQRLADVLGLMSQAPSWAPGLVVKGEGKILERYAK